MVQVFGGFGKVSVLMGVLLVVVGVLLFALRWISAAWLRHLTKRRSSSSSISSGGGDHEVCGVKSVGTKEDLAETGSQPACTRCDTAMLAHAAHIKEG